MAQTTRPTLSARYGAHTARTVTPSGRVKLATVPGTITRPAPALSTVDRLAARAPLSAARVRAVRLAHGRTRWELKRGARALYRAADIVAARGDGNEAARIRRVADDYRAAVTFARWF